MPNTIYKPQINARSKKQNVLSIKSRGRFGSTTHKGEDCTKNFDDLSEFEQKKVLKNIQLEYSLILFDYFSNKNSINSKIKDFTKQAFDIDLPMSKVVEIHLDLIDNLEKQLTLEGLHTEYLSDFRLTLIDVIAHLGELYRNAKCIQIVS